ncbi:FMN-binding protein [Catenisphaera adipataccumulans]|jgi:electron transport complex protein RnfG|uniref:Electron transport complex protein RnfG n=1 Tax=Catenisphaera adipataccumulans TaxID=700500 RepID=A0A7W8CXN3_9FIRM|nr:FMN-binding protein [Catenisphaera adipataccumulans]MBB5183256.1 electron transport complex protein RnfG [Catenisphaera adipataccumulans]
MKKILHLTIFLAVISLIAGGALSYFHNLTAPIIAENDAKQERESLQEMYPDANINDFKKISTKGIDSDTIETVYKYDNYLIFKMSVTGYKDGTVFLVSIDKDTKKIDKYLAISNGDTKGLGSKVMDDDFKNSLEGKDASGKLDTISGATISSSAVTEGINEASGYVDELKGE